MDEPAISHKPEEVRVMSQFADISYTYVYDRATKSFISKPSREQPMVLCQVQYFDPKKRFAPKEVEVGKFLADTGAQVNVANRSLLTLMGIPSGRN